MINLFYLMLYKIGYVPVDKFAEVRLLATLQSERIVQLEDDVEKLQEVAKLHAAKWTHLEDRLYHVENQMQWDDGR